MERQVTLSDNLTNFSVLLTSIIMVYFMRYFWYASSVHIGGRGLVCPTQV